MAVFFEYTRELNFSLEINSNLPCNFFKFTNEFAENIIELRFIDIKFLSYYEFIINLSKLKNMKILKIVDCSFQDNGLILPDDLTLNNIELFLVNIGKVGSIQNAMQDFEISHLLSIKQFVTTQEIQI